MRQMFRPNFVVLWRKEPPKWLPENNPASKWLLKIKIKLLNLEI